MIISRTPLRMSFVGGGSDLPSFYQNDQGAVLSTAINKYVYVTVNEKFDHRIRLSYSKTEEVDSPDEIQHSLVKAALKKTGISGGIEITSIADIPSRGTGLGSSSSFTVGLLNVLHAFTQRFASSQTMATEACEIEIDICKEPIGKQDQFAAAYGGFNLIEFNSDETVSVSPVICKKETMKTLSDRLIVFYTGRTRSASTILAEQSNASRTRADTKEILRKMVRLTYQLRDELQKNELTPFGEILHENWQLKKQLAAGVSDPGIDEWYDLGQKNGATGGKILGAGAGGFLLFYAPEDKHAAIEKALSPLRRVRFDFEREGSRIIFIH